MDEESRFSSVLPVTSDKKASRVSSVVFWGALILVGTAAFFILRELLVVVLTEINTIEFRNRPEVENWAVPSYGTGLPATLISAAAVLAGIIVAIVLRVYLTRRKRTGPA